MQAAAAAAAVLAELVQAEQAVQAAAHQAAAIHLIQENFLIQELQTQAAAQAAWITHRAAAMQETAALV
jgi:hypothetical protein